MSKRHGPPAEVPGCRDLIEDSQTGLVVPYGDVSALGNAIHRLLKDRILAQRLASRAGDEVERHWHIQQTYDAYESIYREIVFTA